MTNYNFRAAIGIALAWLTTVSAQAIRERDVPAQDQEVILYRQTDRDGGLMKGRPPTEPASA